MDLSCTINSMRRVAKGCYQQLHYTGPGRINWKAKRDYHQNKRQEKGARMWEFVERSWRWTLPHMEFESWKNEESIKRHWMIEQPKGRNPRCKESRAKGKRQKSTFNSSGRATRTANRSSLLSFPFPFAYKSSSRICIRHVSFLNLRWFEKSFNYCDHEHHGVAPPNCNYTQLTVKSQYVNDEKASPRLWTQPSHEKLIAATMHQCMHSRIDICMSKHARSLKTS